MTAHIYPGADHTTQWFHNAYPGDTMPHPNVIVLHTTEGSSFPSYGGGGSAPTFTVHPDGRVRQHFYANESARALVNASGGVQTNTLNVVQIELIGTCDKGGPGVYWPSASDAQLGALAKLVKWLTATYPIPLVSTSKPWLSYPKSYGSASGQRMSFSEWNNFNGICGHQHVPENSHGDPGNFPVARLIALVKGTTSAPAPAPKPTAPSTGSTYTVVKGDTLSGIGAKLKIKWTDIAKANGLKAPYTIMVGQKLKLPAKAAVKPSQIVTLNKAVKPGATHAQVAELQQLLIKAGYGPIPGAVTKFYGKNTGAAVARFYRKNPKLANSSYDTAIGPKGFIELQKEAGRK